MYQVLVCFVWSEDTNICPYSSGLIHWDWDSPGHFANDIFRCIIFSENVYIFIIWNFFFPKSQIYNKSALIQVMAWWQETGH